MNVDEYEESDRSRLNDRTMSLSLQIIDYAQRITDLVGDGVEFNVSVSKQAECKELLEYQRLILDQLTSDFKVLAALDRLKEGRAHYERLFGGKK